MGQHRWGLEAGGGGGRSGGGGRHRGRLRGARVRDAAAPCVSVFGRWPPPPQSSPPPTCGCATRRLAGHRHPEINLRQLRGGRYRQRRHHGEREMARAAVAGPARPPGVDASAASTHALAPPPGRCGDWRAGRPRAGATCSGSSDSPVFGCTLPPPPARRTSSSFVTHHACSPPRFSKRACTLRPSPQPTSLRPGRGRGGSDRDGGGGRGRSCDCMDHLKRRLRPLHVPPGTSPPVYPLPSSSPQSPPSFSCSGHRWLRRQRRKRSCIRRAGRESRGCPRG